MKQKPFLGLSSSPFFLVGVFCKEGSLFRLLSRWIRLAKVQLYVVVSVLGSLILPLLFLSPLKLGGG